MKPVEINPSRWLALYLPVIVLLSTVFWVLSIRLLPLPDGQLTITSGRVGGMYDLNAKRYAKLLADHGVTLNIMESAGSGENLARLRSSGSSKEVPQTPQAPPAHIGFVQGGFAAGEPMTLDNASIKTVANVDIEPIWVFTRFKDVDSLLRLQGTKVSIGQPGSGSRVVAMRMLAQVRLGAKDLLLSETAGSEIARALREGRIDAAIFVAAADAPVVQELLSMPDVYLATFKRSAALSERMPYLDARFVAAGSLQPQRTQPAQDMVLLSTLASVLIRDDVHPLLKRRFAHVVKQVHSGAGLLHRAGEFPNLRRLEFSSDANSRRVLLGDLPWLEQHLSPYWSQWVYRLLLIALPLIAIGLLICRTVLVYLGWRVQSRINRWYGELKFIENDMKLVQPGGLEVARLRARIRDISQLIRQSRIPRNFMKRTVVLHQHLELVQAEIHKRHGR